MVKFSVYLNRRVFVMVMKQSKVLNGNLKPEHKKTTICQTTDIDSQVPRSETDWARSNHLVWGPTHHHVIKAESEVINHNWVKNHACSYPQNVHVVIYLFVASEANWSGSTLFCKGRAYLGSAEQWLKKIINLTKLINFQLLYLTLILRIAYIYIYVFRE